MEAVINNNSVLINFDDMTEFANRNTIFETVSDCYLSEADIINNTISNNIKWDNFISDRGYAIINNQLHYECSTQYGTVSVIYDCPNLIRLLNKTIIHLDDIVVKMMFKEMKELDDDNIEPVDAYITIGTQQKKIKLYYNKNENVYFAYSRDLEFEDIPHCKVLTYKEYQKRQNKKDYDLQPQSLLYSYGYKLTDTSDIQRHKVLGFIMDNNIMTYSQIINHLEFLISMHKNQDCVHIWNDDIEYVRNYNRSKIREINID